jgi:hypothetical protein
MSDQHAGFDANEAAAKAERDRMARMQQGPAPWHPAPADDPQQNAAPAGPQASPDMRLKAMEMALHLADGRTHDHKQVVEMAEGILEFLEGPEVVAQRKEAVARKQVEDQQAAVEAQRKAEDEQRDLDARRRVPR